MARTPDKALQDVIRKSLSEVIGKEVITRFREDAGIIGGVIVRIGDRVMDGSLRRQLKILRKQMLSA